MENATTTTYRDELRGKILERARERFKKYGVRQVRMDDVAHSLGISKRTLYEVYPNKEELLLECIKAYHKQQLEEIHDTIEKSWNVMDIICFIYRRQIEECMSISPLFYDELKGYVKVKEYLDMMQKRQAENSKEFFRRGIDEGYFTDLCNSDLVQELSFCINDYIRHKRLYFRYSLHELFRHFVILFIRSICTPKGIIEIDRVLDTTMTENTQ